MISIRIKTVEFIIIVAILLIIGRLFYWQVISAESLASLAEQQHLHSIKIEAKRGEIRTSDDFPLVTNKESFLIYAYTPQISEKKEKIAQALAQIFPYLPLDNQTTEVAGQDTLSPEKKAKNNFLEKLNRSDVSWIPLVHQADLDQKKAVEALKYQGIGIEPSYTRDYSEASMAASTLGFVGSDTAGNAKGYFGLEGFYDLELKGRPGMINQERDPSGKAIVIGEFSKLLPIEGRHLTLHLDRSLQTMVEAKLKSALLKYGAKSGEVVIMEPKTGAILALASYPTYDPKNFSAYQPQLYKNPVIFEAYEPGSTFKVITMAAALDAGVITPETECEICAGPVSIGAYTIRTWNNQYHKASTMTEVIEHSDNIGMVFVARKLGTELFYHYLKKFGIGDKTGIDLQEEQAPPLKPLSDYKEIDLATSSFGQGIAITGMQMLRAVSAVANKGLMPKPQVVSEVIGSQEVKVAFQAPKRVISEKAAETMTGMLVNAVNNGEAKWAKPKGFSIAGKTGTAQIPVAGHYDQEKTIASFVGFAPASDPKFTMLVKLREPQTSPWGSETAAPLWFSIAKDILFYYGIQPDN